MKLFRGLERLDSLQPQIARSFEQVHAEHEKAILDCLYTHYGVGHLEAMMFDLAQVFLSTNYYNLTDEQLKRLTRIKQNFESNLEVHFFRAYLLSKRAKELYDDKNLTNKSIAFVYLYQAGISLGQFLSEVRPPSISSHLASVANKRNVRNPAVHKKLAELIREKRPKEGWKSKTSMAACLAVDMGKHIIEAGMPIKPKNVERAIKTWVAKHEFLTNAYNSNSAKFIKTFSAREMGNCSNSDLEEIS